MQGVQQGLCRVMAPKNGEGLRAVLMVFAYEGAFRRKGGIDDRDTIAEVGETEGGSETGRAPSKNRDGLGAGGCHEDGERNQAPAATASRRLAASRARGPNIRCLGSSIFLRILKYTARMISATVNACWSFAARDSNAACAFA